MKKEELQKIQGVRVQVPAAPVRFTVDDEPFEFNPLPFGTIILVENLKTRLKVNQRMLQADPLVEWVAITHQQTEVIRKIVCLMLGKGKFSMDVFKTRLAYLQEHCSEADLCSLFIIGTIVQGLWIREAGEGQLNLPEGLSEQDLWNKPFVELLKK